MPYLLVLDDMVVGEWGIKTAPPFPIPFTPTGAGNFYQVLMDTWPWYDKIERHPDGASYETPWRGKASLPAEYVSLEEIHIYRLGYNSFGPAGRNKYWGASGFTEVIDSAVATKGIGGPPMPLTWVPTGAIVFRVLSTTSWFRAAGGAATAKLSNSGANYTSGAVIRDVDDAVVLTASPARDGTGYDGAPARYREFWKWVCQETGETFSERQLTVSNPPNGEIRTYTAMWRPLNVKVRVEAGDNGIEVLSSAASGKYYNKSAEGQPAMPKFHARVVPASGLGFKGWTKTVYTRDDTTEALVAATPVTVATIEDPAQPDYEAVQTDRESGDTVVEVVYRAYSIDTHDKVAATVANTYLLKGAGFTKTPSSATRFGDGGYAGAYSLTYNQPTGVDYTVMCRRAGDLPAGTFTGSDSGTFTDGHTGKLWGASYILYAVNAGGEPVGPGEDPTVPEDPDSPSVPGVGGGGGSGGSGIPVGTGVSLQIVSDEADVTAGEAALALGGASLLQVSYPDDPVAVKDAVRGSVYLLTVSGLAPSLAVVKSVTANGTPLVRSGNTWAVTAGSGATSVVVTLGFPVLKTLALGIVSVPSGADPDNSVTVSPAPVATSPDRWVAGTVLLLTPVPVAGYQHVIWHRADAEGVQDVEDGGNPYAFALNADTAVSAGFRKPAINVVLTVKGSDALAAKFEWTAEASDAGDTVPAEPVHDLYVGDQIGLFKIGSDKLQTAGDAAYNTYVDMPIKEVEVSYDGGETWESAAGIYPSIYNAQSSPRAAARVGKHTVSRIPLNDTLHVRVRLIATASISVGMPPVRWGGPPTWSAAGSMIGTGQNNWGCGFGAATISGVDAYTGAPVSATMSYFPTTLANPTATVPVASLTGQQVQPFPDYFNEYPPFNVELGDTINATAEPADGFYFVAWIDGYFSHSWEDTSKALSSEDRLIWPVGNYIATDPAPQIVVNEGIKKVMLRMRATVAPRWVIFTQDNADVQAVRPDETAPEGIVPTIDWAQINTDNIHAGMRMQFSTLPSASLNGGLVSRAAALTQILTDWDATEGEMTALGVTTDTLKSVWKVNAANCPTELRHIAFNPRINWDESNKERFDTHPAYLGVYRRVHLTNKAGTHEVGDWEFVGRGSAVLSGDEYRYTDVSGLAQRFVVDLEYRLRWVPYVEPTTPDEPYQITLGYHEEEDMLQGSVYGTIAGVSTGEINSRILSPMVQPGDVVSIRAVAREGFEFVSWLNAAGEAVSTDAEYTIDPDSDGFVFLANFTAVIVPPVTTVTAFRVGFAEGNVGRGSILVRIWRADATIENYTVTAASGDEYQLQAGDNAYVVAVAGADWSVAGWVDANGLPRTSSAGYYPLSDSAPGGTALYRAVYFSDLTPPVVTGNVPFRAGFMNPADVPHAFAHISVNGAIVATLNGVQYIDMLLTEGDIVSIEVTPTSDYVLAGFVNREYVTASIPVRVANVSVTGQGILAVLGLANPPVGPIPDVTPGTPASGAGLWLFDAGATNKGFVWRSRRFEVVTPTEFNSVMVSRNGAFFPNAVSFRLNAYSSPETTSALADLGIPITDDSPRRLPKIRRERYFEIEVTAKDDIDYVMLASSMGELRNG